MRRRRHRLDGERRRRGRRGGGRPRARRRASREAIRASFSSVAEALDAVAADVLVDYTHAAVVKANTLAAIERGVAVVVGSSGMSGGDYAEVDAAARERQGVGVIAAGNFSITAALLLRFAVEAARHLDSWELIDYASATKPDAPSGTARELAERLGGRATGGARRPDRRRARRARGARRGRCGTQVHSLRLPSFSVSTEAVFAAEGERLSIRHDAGESARRTSPARCSRSARSPIASA